MNYGDEDSGSFDNNQILLAFLRQTACYGWTESLLLVEGKAVTGERKGSYGWSQYLPRVKEISAMGVKEILR